MSLLPYNASTIERALESASSRDLSIPIADLWNPDTCPARLLPWLAWAMHVDNWEEAATEEQKRDSIRMSVHLHRKKGTPWALKRALSTLGLDIDLIDHHEQRELYAAYNPPRLDGTWRLDGSIKLRPLDVITGVPQLQHWAQFIVRLNLADVANPAIAAKLRALVEEWKPQRSWPLFINWLRIYFQITIGVDSHFVMQKRIWSPIWRGLKVTDRPQAIWKLGKDGEVARLGHFALDGTVMVGHHYGAVPGPRLRDVRVTTRSTLTKIVGFDTRPRQRLAPSQTVVTPAPIVLGRWARRLDGAWKVGTPTKLGWFRLDGAVRLPHHPMSDGSRLDGTWPLRNPQHEIPDPALLGRVCLDGTWKVGGPAQPTSYIVSTKDN